MLREHDLNNEVLFELKGNERRAMNYWGQIIDIAGTNGILKGGFIRDKLASKIIGINIEPRDIDILVVGRVNLVTSVAVDSGAVILERRRRKGTPVFKFELQNLLDLDFEIGVMMGNADEYGTATFESIRESDAFFTDLDVNAMSMRINPDGRLTDFYDPHDGVSALSRGEISLVDYKSLYRNPENVFRTIRIADKIGCSLSNETQAIVTEHAAVVKKLEREFLLKQIRPILLSQNSVVLWRAMERYGIIEHLLPEERPITYAKALKLIE